MDGLYENDIEPSDVSRLTVGELAVMHAKLLSYIQKLKVRKRCVEEELCNQNACVDVTDSSTCNQLGRRPFRINIKQNRKTLPHSKLTLRAALLQYLQASNTDGSNGLDAIAEQAVQFVWALRPSKQHRTLTYSVIPRWLDVCVWLHMVKSHGLFTIVQTKAVE